MFYSLTTCNLISSTTVRYGLTHNNTTFDPIHVQLDNLYNLLKRVWNTPGNARVKTRILFYGPGWTTEKPHLRFGDPNDLPSVPNLKKDPKAEVGRYDPKMQGGLGMQMYTLVQFALTIIGGFVRFQVPPVFDRLGQDDLDASGS